MAWDPRPIRLREIPMELDEEEDAVLSSLGAKLALGSSSLTYDDLTGGQSRRGRPLLQMIHEPALRCCNNNVGHRRGIILL